MPLPAAIMDSAADHKQMQQSGCYRNTAVLGKSPEQVLFYVPMVFCSAEWLWEHPSNHHENNIRRLHGYIGADPIAIPISARASAGASHLPPTMATFCFPLSLFH